jgi:hypothetical protein
VTPPSRPLPAGLSPEQRARLEERYGPARRTPVGLLVAVAVLTLAFAGWVVWAALQQADQDVRWRTFGYHDVTDTSVVVEFDVFKRAGVPVTCVVRALDFDGYEVGRAEVPVAAAVSDTHVVYALPVTGRPNAAEVVSCARSDG